jgi:hypothetical protein
VGIRRRYRHRPRSPAAAGATSSPPVGRSATETVAPPKMDVHVLARGQRGYVLQHITPSIADQRASARLWLAQPVPTVSNRRDWTRDPASEPRSGFQRRR